MLIIYQIYQTIFVICTLNNTVCLKMVNYICNIKLPMIYILNENILKKLLRDQVKNILKKLGVKVTIHT